MSTWWQRAMAMLTFVEVDEVLSTEVARNEAARTELAAMRVRRRTEEADHAREVRAMKESVKAQRAAYATEAKPLLAEFDSIGLAQHLYQQVRDMVSGQRSMADYLKQKELGEFGYVSKKLLSVGFHFARLQRVMQSGAPFAAELAAAVGDAESEDVSLMSLPLEPFAVSGVPSVAAVRAHAFDLARAMEETGRAPREAPVRGWLDLLKFRRAYSPSLVEENSARARRVAREFTQCIDDEAFPEALKLAQEMCSTAQREQDASAAELTTAYRNFQRVIVPVIAAHIFLSYARASLNASRFACVEPTLTGH